MILLKVFSGPLSWESFSSSLSILLNFGLDALSYLIFFRFKLFLAEVSISSILSSMPNIPSSIFCILLVMLSSSSFFAFHNSLSLSFLYFFYFHF